MWGETRASEPCSTGDLLAGTDPHYAPGAPPCSLPGSPWEILILMSMWVKIILVSNTICLETTEPKVGGEHVTVWLVPCWWSWSTTLGVVMVLGLTLRHWVPQEGTRLLVSETRPWERQGTGFSSIWVDD